MTAPLPHQPNSGSVWHRWEPHVHAPGTVLNDQFGGEKSWDKYLAALESAVPALRAIAITDYYSTDTYERVINEKAKGRLAGCNLIFPNIEMRLSIATVRDKWVNIHLLVDPSEDSHLVELKRFLALLKFKAHGDTYACHREDLIKLGRKYKPALLDDEAALSEGSLQFKVSFDHLRQEFADSDWAKANVLIAVAGGEGDGTSGIRDAADTTLRREVEKFAHIIFASSPAQRLFWLGQGGKLSASEISATYGSIKPCMHGSDAHDQGKVAKPDGDRYSWIKGEPSFDTLRQSFIDPVGRAFVGLEPPAVAIASQVIRSVDIHNAPWAKTPLVELNPGLVAIIGARGSGKTALADMIAHGCDATTPKNKSSFLYRAQEFLGGSAVTVNWLEEASVERALDSFERGSFEDAPRARYLSQQFVEDLCSSAGVTDELIAEIERVIFEAHSVADRDATSDFGELRELRTRRLKDARLREEETLAELSDRLGVEREKHAQIAILKRQVTEKERQVAAFIRDQKKLVPAGNEARVTRLAALNTAADNVRGYLRYFANREQSLLSIQDEVENLRLSGAPEALRKMKERHANARLKEPEWSPFMLDYVGEVDEALEGLLKATAKEADSWKGGAVTPDGTTGAFISTDADLTKTPLSALEAEIGRLGSLISADRETARQFAALSQKISDETAALKRLKEKLEDCEGAKARAATLLAERDKAYERVFDAIVAEEAVLKDLYSPVLKRLEASSGSLKKLSFTVARVADVSQWAKDGEKHLDLRTKGPFRGKDTLRQLAEAQLAPAWSKGCAADASAAMAAFRKEHDEALMERATVPKSEVASYNMWSRGFSKWLYSTDHIDLVYGIDYDGIDIRKLSPGTRGIVLLLLYLALDAEDLRPLIIDQPEENLDPKSIFDELVQLFVEAKGKRQVIMVTHNANLVVNADADQIIIAEAGPHVPGDLPPISYFSGGLENEHIRKAVCDILEGGAAAFQERARRLRVKIDR